MNTFKISIFPRDLIFMVAKTLQKSKFLLYVLHLRYVFYYKFIIYIQVYHVFYFCYIYFFYFIWIKIYVITFLSSLYVKNYNVKFLLKKKNISIIRFFLSYEKFYYMVSTHHLVSKFWLSIYM